MYYGKYRAKVLKVDKSTKKIKVKCEDIYGDYESPWCTPCIPFIEITSKSTTKEAGDPSHTHKVEIKPTQHEINLLPKVGDNVWIEFEQGIITKPIWCGTW